MPALVTKKYSKRVSVREKGQNVESKPEVVDNTTFNKILNHRLNAHSPLWKALSKR